MNKSTRKGIAIGGLGVLFAMVLLIGLAVPALAASCFTDTEGHWAETYICWLFNNGITSGYPDGSYKPNNNITRAEMAVMLQQVAGAGSAGPVANADFLDGYDSGQFLPMTARADKSAQLISAKGFTPVLAVTLNLPDKCTGFLFIDNWNVLVTATGYISPSGASGLARLGLSVDDSTDIQAGTLRNTDLTVGGRVNFADHWLFTNVGSGSHTFRLMAEEWSAADPDYTIFWPVLTAEARGFSCSGFIITLEAPQVNPDDVDMAP